MRVAVLWLLAGKGSLDCMVRMLMVTGAVAVATCIGGCHWGLLGLVMGSSSAHGPYQAEQLAKDLGPGSVRTLGCLDVGFVPFVRDRVELLDLHIGNRCTHPEQLDVAQLKITGVDIRSERELVKLNDPRREIVPLHVGGAEAGVERLRLNATRFLVRLCFDLDGIAPDAPEARPAPICFERLEGDRWRPTTGGLG
jgi:hypothetical protein